MPKNYRHLREPYIGNFICYREIRNSSLLIKTHYSVSSFSQKQNLNFQTRLIQGLGIIDNKCHSLSYILVNRISIMSAMWYLWFSICILTFCTWKQHCNFTCSIKGLEGIFYQNHLKYELLIIPYCTITIMI